MLAHLKTIFSQSFSIHVMAWFSPTKLRGMNVKNKRFIGRGNLSDKNYVSLVEQHKLSKEYMMQARIGLYHANWFVFVQRIHSYLYFSAAGRNLCLQSERELGPRETNRGFQDLQCDFPNAQRLHQYYLRLEVFNQNHS